MICKSESPLWTFSPGTAMTKAALPTKNDFLPLFAKESIADMFNATHIWLTMNGRNAIYHSLKAFGVMPGDTVLLPAFHCTALVDPVLAFGARVRYYTVHRDFTLELDEIEFLVKQGVQALLYIHYFGFPAPVAALQKISRTYEVKLIEDCSHALFGRISDRPVGTFGHAAVYSFRKTLPVQDGGALILNNVVENGFSPRFKAPWLYHVRMSKWTWESMRGQDQNTNQVPMHSSRTEFKDSFVLKKNHFKGPNSQEDPEFIESWANWPISWPSRWLLLRSKTGMIRRRRTENYLRLHERLAQIDRLKPCFPELYCSVCPLGYPCIVESNERFDYKLRRYGIPAFSFGETLHDSLNRSEFPDSEFLSKNLTILPVHQRLSDNDIDKMAETIATVLK